MYYSIELRLHLHDEQHQLVIYTTESTQLHTYLSHDQQHSQCGPILSVRTIMKEKQPKHLDTNIETVSCPCMHLVTHFLPRPSARAYQKHVLHGQETVSIFIANLHAIFNDILRKIHGTLLRITTVSESTDGACS